MKPNFDNAGVAQVQASVVGLPASELADELAQVRADFSIYKQNTYPSAYLIHLPQNESISLVY